MTTLAIAIVVILVSVAGLVIVCGATLVFDHGVRRGWWQEDWT